MIVVCVICKKTMGYRKDGDYTKEKGICKDCLEKKESEIKKIFDK